MSENMLTFKNKTILYAEDDTSSRLQITMLLEMLFGEVYSACDGEEAWDIYQQKHCDIVLTDIKMPRKDGLELIWRIRQADYETPIVLLTSFMEQQFLFKAANLSVDGYIIKPIDIDTLVKTIDTAFKRTKPEEVTIRLDKNLSFNSKTKDLYHNTGISIVLSSKELKLLQLFIQNQNIILTKEQISEALWPLESICESAIKSIILRLRKKIGEHLIVSIYGIGYRMKLQSNKQRGVS